jgi:hypothetical protein
MHKRLCFCRKGKKPETRSEKYLNHRSFPLKTQNLEKGLHLKINFNAMIFRQPFYFMRRVN